MTMWDVLGIEETKDESVIKKAYRKLIRIHHPEDDPDGFQRVRQAYEDALRYLSSADVPDGVKNDTVPAASESQTHSAEVIQFDEILADAEKRMTVGAWRQWAESIMLLPIDQQEDISKHALRAVMGNRWLPPAVIQTLWESLGWESFHRGTEELQEVGEFLDDWRTQPFILSLEELQALSHAEQRAILGFLRPQEIALSIGQPEAIEYLFSQHFVAAYIPRKETELVLLKSLIASRNRSRAVLTELVERFCGNMASSLTIEQWSLVADAALLSQREELIDVVSEKLLEKKAYPEVADILLRRSIEQGGLISISAAFLCQMWTPLPPVYWRTERGLPQASEDPAKQRLLQWLYGQLLNQNRSHINHRLDLVGLDGIWQLVGSALWAGHSGSWVWLKHILKEIRTAKASETGLTQTLLVLVEQWVMQALENEKGVDSLQLKLSAYESDAIFKAEPLSYEEISSISKLDWMECIRRHPLIPDTWFRQLEDAQIIVFEEIRDDSFFPHYADALCFYRAVNRDFKLSSCWADEVFDGVFDWALWFYSHLATGGAEKQTIRGTLTELPDTQTTQQLGLLLPFSEEEGQYLPDAVTLLNRYPEQFVFRLIVDRQVTLAESLFNHEVLMEKAKSGDLMAAMALSRLIKEEHFDEAIVLWNIVAAESLRFPHLQAVVDWQQQSLLRVREEKGLEQESYEYSKPEFIHAMLTTNREWFTEPKLIQENDPVDEAKPFHYPMLLLLTQLHLGLSEEGYDLSPLKELANRREKQTPLQRDVTDVAVTQLENVYQNRLEQDIEEKGGKAATYSKKRLVFLSIAMFLVWIFIFPWSVLSFPDATFEQVFRSSVFMTVIQGLLIWQISRPIIEKSNKNKYIGYSLFTYFAALIFKAPFIALVNVFSHLYLASSLPPLYAKGGWNRAVVATRKINMRKVLGFKK